MENTEQNKVKLFAQYWGQKVFVNPILDSKPVNNIYLFGYDEPEDIEMEYLELKPLSLITGEDLYFIGVLFGWEEVYGINHENVYYHAIKIIENIYFHPNSHCSLDLYLNVYDYLRSKGYALPWMGLSIEKQVEYGWIKLKE